MNVKRRVRYYSTTELINIALEHSKLFTTVAVWNEHAKSNNLPFHSVFTDRFGSWNAAKKAVGLNVSKREPIYTEPMIHKIIQDNKEYFKNQKTWEIYAKKNRLPRYRTLIKFYSWNEIKHMALNASFDNPEKQRKAI